MGNIKDMNWTNQSFIHFLGFSMVHLVNDRLGSKVARGISFALPGWIGETWPHGYELGITPLDKLHQKGLIG